MITGKLLCLDDVLNTSQGGSRYLLIDDLEKDNSYTISFGTRRKVNVPKNSKIVHISDNGIYKIEDIQFDENKSCNYLNELGKRKIEYEIPKKLEESSSRYYTRFENAIGLGYWEPRYTGYFGNNGYAITKVGYIGYDRYDSFIIDLHQRLGSVCINDSILLRLQSSWDITKSFIDKLLMNELHMSVDEWMKNLREEDLENAFILYDIYDKDELIKTVVIK